MNALGLRTSAVVDVGGGGSAGRVDVGGGAGGSGFGVVGGVGVDRSVVCFVFVDLDVAVGVRDMVWGET